MGGTKSKLLFYYGPMDAGKSTLALQMDFSLNEGGRRGTRLVRHDRSGEPAITTRLGLSASALEISEGLRIRDVLPTTPEELDYVVIDEAQFLSRPQVDQLGVLVDKFEVDVYCFGLLTDFRGRMFPGSQRLIEIADEAARVQGQKLCWCWRPGLMNARVIEGEIQRSGAQVLLGDTELHGPTRYEVLCRRHYLDGILGPPTT